MKVRNFFIVLLVSFFSGLAFAAPPAANQAQDGQVLQTLIVLNAGEVAAANIALKNSNNANIKKFAQLMIRDHSQNLRDDRALAQKLKITLLPSSKSVDLQTQGKAELGKLKTLSNKNFDIAYINAMVNGHQAALKLLDQNLIPHATNPNVIAFLKATRKVVAHHLVMARATQKMLNASA